MKLKMLFRCCDEAPEGTIIEGLLSPNGKWAYIYTPSSIGWCLNREQFQIMPEETTSPALPPEKSYDKTLYDFCGDSAKKITIEFYEVKK